MRYASLGSGSQGNATLVSSAQSCVLIDCGFVLSDMKSRLVRLGISVEQIDAILISHEHHDHIKGLRTWSKRYKTPIYMTAGTYLAGRFQTIEHIKFIKPGQFFNLKDLEVEVIPVAHDAREPVQFIFRSQGAQLGLLTDLGLITPHVQKRFQHCDALLLEMNHDETLLMQGQYPPALKRRIHSHWGHLSNHQALQFLQSLKGDWLQQITALHLSQQNNRLEQVQSVLSAFTQNDTQRFQIATQEAGSHWIVIAPRLANAR